MDSIPTDPPCLPERVSVVGRGRLGGTLARALTKSGIEVSGPTGRHEPVAQADCVLLCVPDAEIAAAASLAAAAAPLIGHCSGATPLAALAPAEAFGLHPLQTFAGHDAPERLHGVGCAVAGSTPRALATAHALAAAVGMNPFEITDADRATYHAAASMASNFLITIEAAAERLATEAGLDHDHARELLAPLVRSTVTNWQAVGPQRALTGPVVRGDEATVAAQRDAVAQRAPELLDLFDVLVGHTRALAQGVPA